MLFRADKNGITRESDLPTPSCLLQEKTLLSLLEMNLYTQGLKLTLLCVISDLHKNYKKHIFILVWLCSVWFAQCSLHNLARHLDCRGFKVWDLTRLNWSNLSCIFSQSSCSIKKPTTFVSVVIKAGSQCCSLPSKTTEAVRYWKWLRQFSQNLDGTFKRRAKRQHWRLLSEQKRCCFTPSWLWRGFS